MAPDPRRTHPSYWTFIRGWLQKRQEKIKERDGYWEPHPTLGRTWVPPVPRQNLPTEDEARLRKRLEAIKANEASHDHCDEANYMSGSDLGTDIPLPFNRYIVHTYHNGKRG